MLENLEKVTVRVKKMEAANDTTIETVLGLEEDELSNTKDELVYKFEVEHDKYMKNSKDIKSQMEEVVVRTEEVLGSLASNQLTNRFLAQLNLELQLLLQLQIQVFRQTPTRSEANIPG